MDRIIRIGTRDSQLALWQANTVAKKLNDLGYQTKIVPVKSVGDIILDKPLYEMGITGVFTKNLDIAMINGHVDIAVHSMKDVPTSLPKNIITGAVLERANPHDILVYKNNLDFLEHKGTIASSSLRRKAQWLHKYPDHDTVDLRGNVVTRLQKLETEKWNGAIFAAAGLERIKILPKNHIILDWMIPAPAQGAILAVVMEKDLFCINALKQLNHKETAICTHVERQFLKTLEGGCTAPIGAFCRTEKDILTLEGALFSLDGKEEIIIKKSISVDSHKDFGALCAIDLLHSGGKSIMETIKKTLNQSSKAC